jgi:hypothetical protein
VLNIDVSDVLLERWLEWFSPDAQPFVVDADVASSIGVQTKGASLTDEMRDVYGLYGLPPGLEYAWLSEAQYMCLPSSRRAALVRSASTVANSCLV